MTKRIAITLLASIVVFSGSAMAGKWNYDNSIDKLSGKSAKRAYIQSEDSLNLDFPYSGSNYGHLIVRKHPQYGLDVIVSVDKGQILCGVYKCKLKIRFDEGSVESFTMNPAADHSSTVVFARYPQWAIDHLKDANNIIVQIPMYNEGNQVLEFRIDQALVWPPKK